MNTLITYHPFGELDEAQNRITRFLGGFPNTIRMGEGNGHSLMVAEWSPFVDITEEDHEYLFKADHRIERSYGTFRRSFTLPQDADGTKVTADFRDGVLKVHLPKTAIAEPKAIEVKVQ